MKFYTKVVAIMGLCLCCAGARATDNDLFDAIINENINGINANKDFINNTFIYENRYNTAIALAILGQNLQVVQAVIDAGADLTARTENKTPLMDAINSITAKKETVEVAENIVRAILRQKEIDINAQDLDGDTALNYVLLHNHLEAPLRTSLFNTIANRFNRIANRLDTNLNISNNLGQTPLILAIKKQYLDIINYLLEDKRDLKLTQQESGSSDTALHLAFDLPTKNDDPTITDVNDPKKNPQLFALTKIIERMNPKDLNIKNSRKATPLMLAQKKNLPKIGALLIDKGADFMIGEKAISETWTDQEIVDAVKRAREKTSRTTPLMELITKKDVKNIKKLLEIKDKKDLKLGQQNIDGYTALMLAIINKTEIKGGVFLAEDLIPLMSRDELNLAEKTGKTALALAIEEKLSRVVNKLIDSGAKATKANLEAIGEKFDLTTLENVMNTIETRTTKADTPEEKEAARIVDEAIEAMKKRILSGETDEPGLDLTVKSELKAINKFAKALYAIKKA